MFKGTDKAQIAIVPVLSPESPSITGQSHQEAATAAVAVRANNVDEVAQYIDCRYIGPSEACHRLFGFPLHGVEPPVIRLQIHLPNYHQLYYQEGNERDAINNQQSSQLLAYFECVNDARSQVRPEQTTSKFLSATELSYN